MAKLGTTKRPAVVRVQDSERAAQIMDLCDHHGIKVIVGVEPAAPEDISDIKRVLEPPAPLRAQPKVGRNDLCPCGSGSKFKKCCLRSGPQTG